MTFEDHNEQLQAVMQAIRTAGLSLKTEKCHFRYEKLKFLGHIVSSTGVCSDPEKATVVALFLMLKKMQDVWLFLRLCVYYCRFVPNFSKIAEPLQQLIKDDIAFIGGSAQSNAFCELQQCLQKPPILGHINIKADMEVHTDASNLSLGAALVHFYDGDERVIAYASRTFSSAEENNSTTKKEYLAVDSSSESPIITTLSTGWRILRIRQVFSQDRSSGCRNLT